MRCSPSAEQGSGASTGAGSGHVFNLGHGVLPETDPGVLAAVVELVHAGDRAPMTTGVLVMAHGTPAGPDDLGPFYTRIRRGRPPEPSQLAELAARYQAIGGVSPLAERTQAQVDALRAELERRAPDHYVVAFGAKHVDPLIEDTAARLARSDLTRVIGLVLTPHGSSMGSQEYLDRAASALGSTPFVPVRPWYAEPGLVDLLAARVSAACRSVSGRIRVIFTAHSLPERILEAGDTYPDQLAESTRLVAQAAGLGEWLDRVAERRAHARALVGSRRT